MIYIENHKDFGFFLAISLHAHQCDVGLVRVLEGGTPVLTPTVVG